MRTAQQMAIESPKVRADTVEVSEFPQVANRYNVMGVPKVVINETRGFEGALPPAAFLDQVMAAGGPAVEEPLAGD